MENVGVYRSFAKRSLELCCAWLCWCWWLNVCICAWSMHLFAPLFVGSICHNVPIAQMILNFPQIVLSSVCRSSSFLASDCNFHYLTGVLLLYKCGYFCNKADSIVKPFPHISFGLVSERICLYMGLQGFRISWWNVMLSGGALGQCK